MANMQDRVETDRNENEAKTVKQEMAAYRTRTRTQARMALQRTKREQEEMGMRGISKD